MKRKIIKTVIKKELVENMKRNREKFVMKEELEKDQKNREIYETGCGINVNKERNKKNRRKEVKEITLQREEREIE